jgi:hypothetical protein
MEGTDSLKDAGRLLAAMAIFPRSEPIVTWLDRTLVLSYE